MAGNDDSFASGLSYPQTKSTIEGCTMHNVTLPSNIIEFQKSFAEKHPEYIQSARQAANICNEVFADTSGPPLDEPKIMCRCLAQTVANSFLSMNLLVSYGHGCDALKIVRSMFEAAVVLASFDHFPDLIQDFIDFRWVKKMKMIKQAKGTPRESLVPPKLQQEIEKNYDAVISRFSDARGKALSSWYRGSFLDMCKKLDEASSKMPWALGQYHDLYRFSSELMHGDIIGLESQTDSSGYNTDMPPSHNYVSESMMSGHWAMTMALASYASIAQLPKAKIYGDQLVDAWMNVWGEGSQEFEAAKKDSEQAASEAASLAE